MPPVKVGLPCCAAGHDTGPGLVVASIWLMGYPSPVVEVRTGADEPVLNALVVVDTAVGVIPAGLAEVVAIDAVDVPAVVVIAPVAGVLYLSAYSFSC